MHSYVLYLSTTEEGGLDGILVASDRIRNKELLQVSSVEIIKIFDLAAKGEGDKAISMRYDDKKQDYVVRLHRARKDKT